MDLLAIDRAVFLALNGAFRTPWLDQVMMFLTSGEPMRWLYAAAGVALVVLGRRRGLVILLGAVLTITLSDQLAAHVIKPWVGRARPCNTLSDVELLVRCSGSFSFPSAHAANTFAGAFYFSRFAPGITIPLAVVAFLVSYSRVYVGVHYPLDLVGGGVLGVACAALVLALMSRARVGPRGRVEPPPGRRAPPPPPPPPSSPAGR